jgi:hypothetical protein
MVSIAPSEMPSREKLAKANAMMIGRATAVKTAVWLRSRMVVSARTRAAKRRGAERRTGAIVGDGEEDLLQRRRPGVEAHQFGGARPVEDAAQRVLQGGGLDRHLVGGDDAGAGRVEVGQRERCRPGEGDPGGGVGDDLGQRALAGDQPGVHDGDPVGEPLGLLQVVGGQQQRRALLDE